MYCPSCGKSISDESIFCMFCGKKLGTEQNVSNQATLRTIPENQPISIGIWYFGTCGPTDTKKIRNSSMVKVGRGFLINIFLDDAEGRRTAANGELIFALLNEYDQKPLECSIKQARWLQKQGSDPKSKHSGSIITCNITTTEFQWYDFNDKGKQWKDLMYAYRQIDPLVYMQDYNDFFNIRLHAWFITSSGNCLYAYSGLSTRWV